VGICYLLHQVAVEVVVKFHSSARLAAAAAVVVATDGNMLAWFVAATKGLALVPFDRGY
jgi:hypothetical protein